MKIYQILLKIDEKSWIFIISQVVLGNLVCISSTPPPKFCEGLVEGTLQERSRRKARRLVKDVSPKDRRETKDNASKRKE